jgi:hypothetical protein
MVDLMSLPNYFVTKLPVQSAERPLSQRETSGHEKGVRAKNKIAPYDVAAIVFSVLLIPFFELARTGYSDGVSDWLDNPAYVEIANVIRFGGIPYTGHFWGLPAVMAVTQVTFGISGFAAIVAISVASSVVACFLIHRLYGSVVTATFLILCPVWVQISVAGGSEPLFLCLLLGSWLAFRSDRALMAAVFASCAMTVRPVGFFALCAFAFTLILQRDWRRLAISVCIAAGIGLAYLEWVQMVTGDPFINFRLYSSVPSGNPFSLPFVQLSKDAFDLFLHKPRPAWIEPLFSLALVGFGVFSLSKQMPTLLRPSRTCLRHRLPEFFTMLPRQRYGLFRQIHDPCYSVSVIRRAEVASRESLCPLAFGGFFRPYCKCGEGWLRHRFRILPPRGSANVSGANSGSWDLDRILVLEPNSSLPTHGKNPWPSRGIGALELHYAQCQ